MIAWCRDDRPDQHVYQLMAETGPLADAPYVMLTNVGPVGRFNRAQRACYNLDESMPLFLVGLMLVAAVFGPLAPCVAAVYAYGAATYARLYKNDLNQRLGGFLFLILAYQVSAGLVLLVAVKTTLF